VEYLGGETAQIISNHQYGQAFDLNTRHNMFDGSDKIYEWLKRNGPAHGFVRTVSMNRGIGNTGRVTPSRLRQWTGSNSTVLWIVVTWSDTSGRCGK